MEQRFRPTPRRRTAQACDRCRRQKLKCNAGRPCLLCVHSGNKCETSQHIPPSTGTAKQRSSAAKKSRDVSCATRPSSEHNPVSSNTWDGSSASDLVTEKQPSANASTVDFARQVFNETETGRSLTSGAVPGDTGRRAKADTTKWCLKELQLPPDQVMWAAIDAHFSRTNWFLYLLHEASFRTTAKRVLASGSWERRDISDVLLVLTVAAVGLKAALMDRTWTGHETLEVLHLDGCEVLKSLVSEVCLHLLDLMEESRIEAVQVCLLLSSLYGYHDSPTLAWTLARMGINVGIYLELYKAAPSHEDPVMTQLRHCCWNSVVIFDTYISITYGRPVSTDTAFARLHVIQDFGDMPIDPVLLGLPAVKEICDTFSRAPFYNAHFRLYGLIRRSISRSMHIRSSSLTETDRFEATARCASESEISLQTWAEGVPSLYDFTKWVENSRWKHFEESLRALPSKARENGEVILLQAASLQLTYDGALIVAHQPLLESRTNTGPWSNYMVSSVQKSLGVAVEAAFRISRFPVHLFKKHFAISFIFFHLFTAGVILCLVPPIRPFTSSAQEAKSGVVKIIQACRAMRDRDRTAKQTEDLLIELLKVTSDREMKSALEPSRDAERIASLFDSTTTNKPSVHDSNYQHAEGPSATPLSPQRYPYPSGEVDQSILANESTGFNADSASLIPTAMPQQPAQALQQYDDTFGPFGKSMLNLIFNDQLSSWDMESMPPMPNFEAGETGFL